MVEPLSRHRLVRKDLGGCWVWTGSVSRGYGHFTRNRPKIYAHRQSWIETYGPIPDGLRVCHTCDNPPCVNPEHLFLGTMAANVADRDAKGRTARGTRNGRTHERRLADLH